MDVAAFETYQTYNHIVEHLGWSILAFSRGDIHGEKTLRLYISKTTTFTGYPAEMALLNVFLEQTLDTSKDRIKRKKYEGLDIDLSNAKAVKSTFLGLFKWHDHAFRHFGRVIVKGPSTLDFQLYAEQLGILYKSLKAKKESSVPAVLKEDLRILMHNVLVLIASVTGKKLSELSDDSYISISPPPLIAEEFEIETLEDDPEVAKEHEELDAAIEMDDREEAQRVKRHRENIVRMDSNNVFDNMTRQLQVNQKKIQLHNNLFLRGSEQAPWAAKI